MSCIYRCPVCKSGLERVGGSFACNLGHNFDVSREGYVNLLLANQKKTSDPGDNKAMAEGRQKFLDMGYYDFLSDDIQKIVVAWVATSDSAEHNVLDLGCGVGFYVGRLSESFRNIMLWGMDISRSVIQKAAKRYSDVQFSIGSGFNLPFLDNSLDMVISIFAPFDLSEVCRVLKTDGKVLLVRPGPTHLKELAELIYDKFELQGNTEMLPTESGLNLQKTYNLERKIEIRTNEDLLDLVSMTPYYWHLNEEKKKRLEQVKSLTVSLDFQISVYEKSGS